jgi:bacteriocin-like protein
MLFDERALSSQSLRGMGEEWSSPRGKQGMTMRRSNEIRELNNDEQLNDEELDAVSGGCYVTCGDGKGRTGGGTSKGWVADLVATIQTIVYGHPGPQ